MNTVRTAIKRKYKKVANRSNRAEEYKSALKNILEGFNTRLDEAEGSAYWKTGQWNSPT